MNVWVKLSATFKVAGKGDTPVNLAGRKESIGHGKLSVKKQYCHELLELYVDNWVLHWENIG